MTRLVPFSVDPRDLSGYRRVLQQALDGGDAIAPMADADAPNEREVPDGVALVVSTSGSTGRPKRAMLTADNLRASAEATHARIGGPGQWLLPMPPHHIAGTQVLVRSIVAGTEPVHLNRFSVDGFVSATAELTHDRCYTSLVPTQLVRLLDAAGTSATHARPRPLQPLASPQRKRRQEPADHRAEVLSALLRYDAILLGGAASAPALLERAARAGVRVHTTYGMSETAGGCVYDGMALDGTTVELEGDRIVLRGNTVALGYLGDPVATQASFDGQNGFRTGDLGRLVDGELQVIGRADDLINTGGMKVAPRVVEDALHSLDAVAEAVVLATPHAEWGEAVSAAVVARRAVSLQQIRDELRPHLPAYALPRRLLVLNELPLRGPGKPDRRALAASDQWQDWSTPLDAE